MEKYPVPKAIKFLYHGTLKTNRDNILREGLKRDSSGVIYLSQKPLEAKQSSKYVTFHVVIPNQDELIDWRDVWYDENGEEIDPGSHSYDEENPYYLYLLDIPPEYLAEI